MMTTKKNEGDSLEFDESTLSILRDKLKELEKYIVQRDREIRQLSDSVKAAEAKARSLRVLLGMKSPEPIAVEDGAPIGSVVLSVLSTADYPLSPKEVVRTLEESSCQPPTPDSNYSLYGRVASRMGDMARKGQLSRRNGKYWIPGEGEED